MLVSPSQDCSLFVCAHLDIFTIWMNPFVQICVCSWATEVGLMQIATGFQYSSKVSCCNVKCRWFFFVSLDGDEAKTDLSKKLLKSMLKFASYISSTNFDFIDLFLNLVKIQTRNKTRSKCDDDRVCAALNYRRYYRNTWSYHNYHQAAEMIIAFQLHSLIYGVRWV